MNSNKKQQIIEVLPYDPNWPTHFMQEADEIKSIFTTNFSAIHHIGSTAIINMPAKPTIDILLEVHDILLVDHCNYAMQKIGYEAWGEYHIPGRRFFVKGQSKRTHHVHTFQKGSDDILRHRAFRDYLQANSNDAKKYADLKIKLATQYRNNRRAYVSHKQDFVKDVEKKALEWLQSQRANAN